MWKFVSMAILMVLALSGCQTLGRIPPPRFPQLNERLIAGPGEYARPRWSPEGRYLALIEERKNNLIVYDFASRQSRRVAADVFQELEWDPSGWLSYVRFLPDRSGNPFPDVNELRLVNRDGTNDHVIASNLYGAGDLVWFRNGQKLLVLLTEPESRDWLKDIYLLDLTADSRQRLVTRQELNVKSISTMSLSPDETKLLLYVDRNLGGLHRQPWFIVYNLVTQHIDQEIDQDQVLSQSSSVPHVQGTFFEQKSSFVEVSGNRWVIDNVAVPEGECYNYAIYFLNLDDLSRNFCIPSVKGIVSDVAISPDLSKIAYVTVVGPGVSYVMVADLTAEYRARLGR